MPNPIVYKSPDIMSGTPVFYGTRRFLESATELLVARTDENSA
jgi:uncharacterized protein (DUF433 family)